MGGGSSGGGSSSGKIDYPSYIKDIHGRYTGNGAITSSITTSINRLLAASPYNDPTYVIYKPDSELNYMQEYICRFKAIVDDILPQTEYSNYFDLATKKISEYQNSANVSEVVSAHAKDLNDQLEYNTLPLYRRGMQNIHATYGSAYKLGEAWLHEQVLADIDKFGADLRLQIQRAGLALVDSAISQMFNQDQFHVDKWQNLLTTSLSIEQTTMDALNKYHETYNSYLVDKAMFPLNITTALNDSLRSIAGGGAAASTSVKKDPILGAIGGGLTGAATGALLGSALPVVGTGLGAVGGAAIGIAGGLFG